MVAGIFVLVRHQGLDAPCIRYLYSQQMKKKMKIVNYDISYKDYVRDVSKCKFMNSQNVVCIYTYNNNE